MNVNKSNPLNSNNLLKIILVVLLVVIVVLLLLRYCDDDSGGQVLEPDYELVDPDQNASAIPGDTVGETPTAPQGGGSMSLIYSDQVRVDLATGHVGLYYQNPSDSTHSIVVQIIIQRGEEQYLVAQSGAINRGFMLTELTLEEDMQLAPGVYEGVMKLLFFDPITGERAVVDTNIPVDITVQ